MKPKKSRAIPFTDWRKRRATPFTDWRKRRATWTEERGERATPSTDWRKRTATPFRQHHRGSITPSPCQLLAPDTIQREATENSSVSTRGEISKRTEPGKVRFCSWPPRRASLRESLSASQRRSEPYRSLLPEPLCGVRWELSPTTENKDTSLMVFLYWVHDSRFKITLLSHQRN